MRGSMMLISLLVLGGCPPSPAPEPDPKPPEQVEEEKAVENAVITTETMAATVRPTNCEATRVQWDQIDDSSLPKAKEAEVERTPDQVARYDAAVKEAAKVIPNCRGETQCTGGCPDCGWVDCIEHLIACPADAQRCCVADACISSLD